MDQNWYRFTLDMNLILLTLDLNGNFTSLNPLAEKIYHHSAAELIGVPFISVLDPFSQEKAEMMVKLTFTEGGVNEWELDHVQPGTAPILIGYTTTRLTDENGNINGLGAYGVDLSSKLQLTEMLAESNQQLEGALLKLEKVLEELKMTQAQLVHAEKMRTLGQLVAGIAHEINNPAAFVANNLEHLKRILPNLIRLFEAYHPFKTVANPEQQSTIIEAEDESDIEYLWGDLQDITNESLDGIERIRNIVLSLRTFSHLDEAEVKFVDISEGLRSTIQLIRPICKNRIVIVENLEQLPLMDCRPGELNQVFLNLLMNAAQAVEGQGQIEVSSYQDQEFVVVKIHDSGGGMDEATMARLGEPFFTTKPVGSGTGLGLSISYGIIERHHGKIRFESQMGAGTTVYVEIPLK